MERFFDICDKCSSRELDFIFFDLKCNQSDVWIKDIPGYRCRSCGEVLASSGVIDTLDEVSSSLIRNTMFPMLRYQKRVVKAAGADRDITERLLHAWSFVQGDGRETLQLMGFRTFGDLKALTAI